MSKLKKAFLEFHAANPWVYNRMVEHCRVLKQRGFTRYSSRTLISVMRFEWDIKTTGEEVRFKGDVDTTRVKLNDHHTPYYARMIMQKHPEFADFFSMRELEADDDGVYPAPPPASVGPPLPPSVKPLPELARLAWLVEPLRFIATKAKTAAIRQVSLELIDWIVEACAKHGVPVPKPPPPPQLPT